MNIDILYINIYIYIILLLLYLRHLNPRHGFEGDVMLEGVPKGRAVPLQQLARSFH